jgi:hypothetical protein
MERFWNKVVKRGDEECWEWQGAKTGNGYGGFKINGKMMAAHRIAWELASGAIPDGAFVLHRCDNPICVRPDHLFLGTLSDNAQDREAKGRGNTASREKHWNAKVTVAQVEEIRARAAEGASGWSLAKVYGLSVSQVCRIIRGEDWSRGGDQSEL